MIYFFSLNIYSLLIEIFILFNLCLLLLFGVVLSTNSKVGYPIISIKSINFLFLQVLIYSLFLSYYQYPIFMLSWNNFLINDSFSFYSKIFILFSTIVWYFLTFDYVRKNKINNFEYWIIILLSILAILLIIQSYDLLSIYLTLEFQSLTFYILASFNRNSEFSTEAGLKYFLLGAFSSAFLLFGFSLLYSFTGLTNLNDFSNFFIDNQLITKFYFSNLIYISISLILVSFFFKLSAVPFHAWLPDVYEGTPASIMIFFATIPKIAILNLLIRLVNTIFYEFDFFWYSILVFCIFLSSFIGTFGAFYQKKWKRFLAYSSINHLSFFLLALISNNLESLQNLFIYLFIYLFMLFGFCSFFINFNYLKYPNIVQNRFFLNLQSINLVNPLISISLLVIIFSMAGIPPLAGFFSKFFILVSTIRIEIFGLILFILLFNSISCFYYLRLIQLIFFNIKPKFFPFFFSLDYFNSLIIGFFVLLILMLFIDLDFIYLLVQLITFSF